MRSGFKSRYFSELKPVVQGATQLIQAFAAPIWPSPRGVANQTGGRGPSVISIRRWEPGQPERLGPEELLQPERPERHHRNHSRPGHRCNHRSDDGDDHGNRSNPRHHCSHCHCNGHGNDDDDPGNHSSQPGRLSKP